MCMCEGAPSADAHQAPARETAQSAHPPIPLRFATHTERRAVQIEIFTSQRDKFTDADAGVVEQREDGAVAPTGERRQRLHGDEPRDLVGAERGQLRALNPDAADPHPAPPPPATLTASPT